MMGRSRPLQACSIYPANGRKTFIIGHLIGLLVIGAMVVGLIAELITRLLR